MGMNDVSALQERFGYFRTLDKASIRADTTYFCFVYGLVRVANADVFVG